MNPRLITHYSYLITALSEVGIFAHDERRSWFSSGMG